MASSLWKFFTSLRLTVACLAIGVLLVFFGTLAQVHDGLYQAQAEWFRSFFIWWQPKEGGFKLPIFPGGYTLGFFLLANLVAAHIKRFVWSKKKIGIHLTHLGVTLLLVGQLATDMLSRESTMSLAEGETKRYSEDQRKNELVFATDAGNGEEQVVSVGELILAKQGIIDQAALPFTVKVKAYYPNSSIVSHKSLNETGVRLATALAKVEAEFATPEGLAAQAVTAKQTEGRAAVWREALAAIGESSKEDLAAAAARIGADPVKGPQLCTELKNRFHAQMTARFKQQGGAMQAAADRLEKKESVAVEDMPAASKDGAGKGALLIPKPELKTMDRNVPAAIIEAQGRDGKVIGEWLVSPWLLSPETFQANGKTYRASFRFERYYHPFSVTLLKATHEVYAGTDIPKNFQSRVRVDNAAENEHREVDIYMNNPLRYDGLTFYQFQMGQAQAEGETSTSTLQIVRNPSWLTPYLGCLLVGIGMVVQFTMHLLGFVAKRRSRAASPAAAPTSPATPLQTAGSAR